jgi:hypothetical protein
MIWQTPAVFLAIIGVLLAGLTSIGFPRVQGDGVKLGFYLIVLAFAFAVSWVGTVQLRKHKLFSDARVHDLRWLTSLLQAMGDVYTPQFITWVAIRDVQRYPEISRKWIDRQSAYRWLFGLSSTVTVLLGLSLIILPILAYLNWV